jgi:hypothetical protein
VGSQTTGHADAGITTPALTLGANQQADRQRDDEA